MTHPVYVDFPGKIVMVGFGSIGQGVLPLLLRHINIKPEQITIVTGDDRGQDFAKSLGVNFQITPLKQNNYEQILKPMIAKGDFLLSLVVDVESVSLMKLAHDVGALYLDTVVECWPGGYNNPDTPVTERGNYAMREEMLEYKRTTAADSPTAVVTHGANPGLVSHFLKRALLNIAKDTGHQADTPKTRAEWAKLAQDLGVKVVHVAERDTQVGNVPKEVGEFVNTWSIEGFYGEGVQPAELGWGSHEKHFPHDGHRYDFGTGAAIYLNRGGANTKVRSWTPMEGSFHGFLVTHNESISIADYFSIVEGDKVVYRPTVHYAYHPCDDAVLSMHELAGKNWQLQSRHRILMDEILPGGVDELGVLVCGHGKNAYWYGSQLSIDDARVLVPQNNATSLQVTASVLAGVIWAIENPNSGVREPEEIDHERILEIAGPYIEPMVGAYSDWTPLKDRSRLFSEDMDTSDPWQFKNIRVI